MKELFTQKHLRQWLGMGGIPPHDNPLAYIWERRLHWVMVVVALLALPAFLLDTVFASSPLVRIAYLLDLFIFLAFTAEFIWMVGITRHRGSYILNNWLDLLIIIGSAGSIAGIESEWMPLARLLRVAYISLILLRTLGSLRNLFSPTAVPYILGWGVITLALAGGGFYWLEPTVTSYSDGLWLAFTSGATVGYGDIVPTTLASKIFAVFMVFIGYAILSIVTASIAAFFVGVDEKLLRREMHQDIKALREEVSLLREQLGKQETK